MASVAAAFTVDVGGQAPVLRQQKSASNWLFGSSSLTAGNELCSRFALAMLIVTGIGDLYDGSLWKTLTPKYGQQRLVLEQRISAKASICSHIEA